MIHREATPCKFLAYPPYAVSAFVFLEDTLDFRGYICISLLNFICFPNLIVVCRPGQLHRCQQIFQGISFFTEFFDERCFFALSCAAHLSSLKAISFFMTAFSASRYSILALSRIISSRSDGVSSAGSIFFFISGSLGGRPFRSVANPSYPSILYRLTHCRNRLSSIPDENAVSLYDAPARTFATSSYFSSTVHTLLCFLCRNASGPQGSSILNHLRIIL